MPKYGHPWRRWDRERAEYNAIFRGKRFGRPTFAEWKRAGKPLRMKQPKPSLYKVTRRSFDIGSY